MALLKKYLSGRNFYNVLCEHHEAGNEKCNFATLFHFRLGANEAAFTHNAGWITVKIRPRKIAPKIIINAIVSNVVYEQQYE